MTSSEDALRQLEIIFDSTHDGIIAVDGDARITLFNRAAEEIIRCRARDVIGCPVAEVVPFTRLPAVLSSGEAELNCRQALDHTSIITTRMPIVDGKGETIGAFAVFRDVTRVVALAEEVTNLREMRIMWEAIFNSTQDAISVVDAEGIQVSVNPAYTRVTGLPEEGIIGQPCTVDIAEGESIHLRVLSTKKPITGVRLKVGPHSKEVIVDAAPIVVNGEVRGSVAVIKDLTEIVRLNSELRRAQQIIRKLEARYSFDDLVGQEPVFQHAVEKARVAATVPATVLLQGESGTGKELFAHAIHNASDRRDEKFVRVNCASLSEGVLESELFGYEDGAFTGARKGGRIGLFQEADGGTIFLDEIGLMSLTTQAKLLRVLQESEVRRVGGTTTRPINVRVVAATNADLLQAVQEGQFREDLYYRLNVIPVEIPALRDHRGDIPLLISHFIRRINQEYGRAVSGVAPGAMDRLVRYRWPGNVRELENVLRRAMINMGVYESIVGEVHLPELLPQCDDPVALRLKGCPGEDEREIRPLEEAIGEVEAAHIARALELCGGSRTRAATKLGISIRSLQYKLRRHGLT
ncbi:MAG: sigma-54-dependent transcriptional regulator [Spirochaetaceae bacterium]|nr:MAG: sigma-54-dependent transcriptional regulator [Spirochaetaceae bacterium]